MSLCHFFAKSEQKIIITSFLYQAITVLILYIYQVYKQFYDDLSHLILRMCLHWAILEQLVALVARHMFSGIEYPGILEFGRTHECVEVYEQIRQFQITEI